MEDKEVILSGPEFTGAEYVGSLAEYIIPEMKSWPRSFIAQVDCASGESITGYEFLQESLKVTEGLIEFGLKEGDVVIFASANNIRSHVTAIGILLSGTIFAPIDRTLKTFELRHFFKEFQPKCIICETTKAKEIHNCVKSLNLDAKIVLIDSDASVGEFYGWNSIRKEVDVNSYIPRTVKDSKKSIATINCSSGSTGLPKGVSLSHYAILFNLSLTKECFAPEFNQNLLLLSPLYWFSGTSLLINSCFFGLTRCIPKSTDSEDVLKGIEECKPYYILLVPSHLVSLVEHPNFHKYDLSSVKLVASAGATLGKRVAEKVKQKWKGIVLSNNYGLTETCGPITVNFGSEEECTAVGKIISEVKVKIVDPETGKSLGPYKTGEMRVKTKRLMNGYYKNEEATKGAFDEKGWFRTGDLLYYDEKEVFYFFGRMKTIIQYKHYQISPSEVESFISSLPGVKDVAIVYIPHEIDTNHIRALVVKDPNVEITAEEIINQVKENLAAQKNLTGGVQFVDSLPRSEAGKLKLAEAQKMVQNINTEAINLPRTAM